MRNESGRTGAVDKAIRLYETLRSTAQPLRLSDLSRRTGLAKSTTHRLLGSLAAAGMVCRRGIGYVAIRPVGDRSAADDQQRALLCRLAPFVCDAVIRTEVTASLAVLEGTDVTFVHRVYGHDNVSTSTDSSGRDRADRTAAGRLLLSLNPRLAHDAAVEWGFDPASCATLQRDLNRIRRSGFAVREAEGVVCLAVPLHARPDGWAVALTVKGRPGVADQGRTLFRLRTVAASARSALAETDDTGSTRATAPQG